MTFIPLTLLIVHSALTHFVSLNHFSLTCKVGIFISGVIYYSLAHAFLENDAQHNTFTSVINGTWARYENKYRCLAQRSDRTDDCLSQVLFSIARESVGWAGFWLWRYTSPNLFAVTCEQFFKLPDHVNDLLSSPKCASCNVSGIEIFRESLSRLSAKLLTIGFGDSTPKVSRPEFVVEPINSLVSEMVVARSNLKAKVLATLLENGKGRRVHRRASSLRSCSRRMSDSSLLFAIKDLEIKTMLNGGTHL